MKEKTERKRIQGANPYMPLWEHVPDGEPRVFTYNGEKRVYVYGSHDMLRNEYCGTDQVVWSAPVEDLTNWTCHGVCYEAQDKSVLFAPDVVQKGDTYYLYAAQERGEKVMVAKSKNPAGPFTDPVLTDLGFDPGVLVDDDGRVYAYWGFSKCYCCELNEDMATIKAGTLHEHPMGHARTQWSREDGHVNFEDGFFEASSPRKVLGKYVYIYSKMYNEEVPELGVTPVNNGFLSYKYSDNPLEGFVHGGDVSFNGGEILTLPDGTHRMTYQWGNNHGSIVEIEGQWYVFYHRQTGLNEFSRQAMLEPVEVAMDEEGRLFIGKITYEERNGKKVPVSSGVVEMTSQGPHADGLDAYCIISAGYACHIYHEKNSYVPGSPEKAYVKPIYEQTDTASSPIVNIQNGCTVGFRYLQFGVGNASEAAQNGGVSTGGSAPLTVHAAITAKAELRVQVRRDSYDGEVVAGFSMKKGETEAEAEVTGILSGKAAVYFEFLSEAEGEIAEFLEFYFA